MGSEGPTLGTAFQRKQCTFFNVARVLQVKAVQPQLIGFWVVEGYCSGVVWNDLPEQVEVARRTFLNPTG